MITRADIAAQDALVCRAIHLSAEDLFWMKLDRGCEFLRQWIGEEHVADIHLMEQLPEFWAWWQQLWYIRDRKFLAMYHLPCLPVYERYHDPKRLTERPNSAIMASYHELIKTTTRKVRDGINQ